ncbi:MAG: PIG-L family deacetylase [Melioribacteraceae bacterium]
MNKKVLAIGTHPDDVEIMCAGTLALLKEKKWEIAIATMTAGDCGSATLSRDKISEIRKNEASISATLIDANYYCMENDDIFIMYDRTTLLKAINLIREVKPDLVITQSPIDYMVDHEITSKVVKTACFSAGIKNIKTEAEPFMKIPHLYYMDSLEGIDDFGESIKPTTFVDISSTIEIKEKMLATHQSQRSWLMSHNGIDEYIITMKNFSSKRGKEIDVNYAEGFRQHLGHAYPKNNILKEELSKFAKIF